MGEGPCHRGHWGRGLDGGQPLPPRQVILLQKEGTGLTSAPQDGLPCLSTSARVNPGAHNSSREPLAHECSAFVKARTSVGESISLHPQTVTPAAAPPAAAPPEPQKCKPSGPNQNHTVRRLVKTFVSEGALVLQALLVPKACDEGPLQRYTCVCVCFQDH